MANEKLTLTKDMIGVCGYMLRNKETDCQGDYLGRDNLCDNPFNTCLKISINDCLEKGYIKLEHDEAGCMKYCTILKINEDLEII